MERERYINVVDRSGHAAYWHVKRPYFGTASRHTYSRFRKTSFFGSLDGLRAISIAGVIWIHSWADTPYYAQLEAMPVLRHGSFGVHIFFAISGFLITTLLLRERERFGQISIRDFYIRRILRIWPLYYATLGLYIVLVLLLEPGSRSRGNFLHYLPSFLTYTYTWFISPKWPWGHFHLAWTLATEEQFYAFWPVVLRVFRAAWSSVVIVTLIALQIATSYGWTDRILSPDWLPTRIVLNVSIAICLGVLLAQGLHSERYFRWWYLVFGQKWSAPAALVALAICLFPERVPLLPAFVAAMALVGTCVIREDNGLAFMLRQRPIAYIGVLSYGMYLFNSLSIHLVQSALGSVFTPHPLLVFPLAFGLAMGAAYVSYRYFESRFLELKIRFSPLRSTTSAVRLSEF
ncbi:MAG TPA: acyltransferase [Candidatus Acidoferrum sp.]|jgi:peptidoglycan/LPS O-acetylase OafA/YrhL|nr:acyltransferase [Candidatus Acidoferrum sp.]